MEKDRIIDRLDRYARYKALNDNQITREAGLAIGTLGKSRKPGKDLSLKMAAHVLARFPELNRDWLLMGEGAMLVGAPAPPPSPSREGYPLIDIATAECGVPFGELQAIMENDLPKIFLPGIPKETDFFVRSSGYSMINEKYPELSIPPGSYVGLTRVNGNVIRWGEVYAIATTDGIMLKRISPNPDSDDIIICSSYSPEFPDFQLRKDEICDYARLTCVIPFYRR